MPIKSKATKRATTTPKKSVKTVSKKKSTNKKIKSTKKTSSVKELVIGPFRYKSNPKGGIKPIVELDRKNRKVKADSKGAYYSGKGTKEDPIIIEMPSSKGNIFIDLTK